uniref:Uncharacterized protein n=1 Tax=Arundo donax TaxID=35708 RepID=A0A0A8YFX9_ARUDO
MPQRQNSASDSHENQYFPPFTATGYPTNSQSKANNSISSKRTRRSTATSGLVTAPAA